MPILADPTRALVGEDVLIDDAETAQAAVQRWLNTAMPDPAGTFRVAAVADIGPAWRAVFDMPSTTWLSVARVDKISGLVEMDYYPSLKVGPSARDGYLRMLRTTVRPELKRLGFTGSGAAYTLPTPDHFATISFQQSSGNTWVRAKFTVNVQVIARRDWSQYAAQHGHGDTPDPDSHYRVGSTERLGQLSRHGYDYWWSVWAGFPTTDVAGDVIAAIRTGALPAMRQRISHGP